MSSWRVVNTAYLSLSVFFGVNVIIDADSNQRICDSHVIENCRISCIDHSQIPLINHGSLSIRGFFSMSMKCENPDEDIPADAPGNPPGVLFCDGNSEDNQHLRAERLVFPKCQQKEVPFVVQLGIDFYFNETDAGRNHQRECTRLLSHLSGALDGWTNGDIKTKISEQLHVQTFRPDDSRYYQVNNNKTYCVARLGLVMAYYSTISIDELGKWRWLILEGLMRSNASFQSNTAAFTLATIDVASSWVSACSDDNMIGTVLGLHGIASCRNCSKSFYKAPHLDVCLQCPFGQTTPEGKAAGFSDCAERECKLLPFVPANQRGKLLRDCYYRN